MKKYIYIFYILIIVSAVLIAFQLSKPNGICFFFPMADPILFQEVHDITEHISAKYPFIIRTNDIDPLVFYPSTEKECYPILGYAGNRWLWGHFPHEINVYYVLNLLEQNKIIAIAKQYRRETGIKPFWIHFYKEEVWHTYRSPDGKESGASRGEEELLRRVKIR